MMYAVCQVAITPLVCVRACMCVMCIHLSHALHTPVPNRSQFCFGVAFYINCLESSELCVLKCAWTATTTKC